MSASKAVKNQVTYQGELINGKINLISVKYPSEFVDEDGKVVMTCEPSEKYPKSPG